MWPLRKKRDDFEDQLKMAGVDAPATSRFTLAQQEFMLRALRENPGVKPKELADMMSKIRRARDARCHGLADRMLETSLSINGQHSKRVVRDNPYWEQYQAIFYPGRQLDRVAYLVGHIEDL